MANVDVRIQGRTHTLSCDDGQEHRLRQVAQYLDRRLQEASRGAGGGADPRVVIMTSLLICDELADARDEIDALKRRIDEVETRASAALERVAGRIEDLAQRIESA